MIVPRLAIRADAGPGIGAGHVMRSVALADAWRRAGGEVEWFSRPLPPLLGALLQERAITTYLVRDDWTEVTKWAHEHRGSWVCIDGYPFRDGPPQVRAAGARVLVIDDDRRWGSYECDALLNQVVGSEQLPYDINTDAVRLTGTRYCLIRKEMLSAALRNDLRDDSGTSIFVGFGGHDAHGQGERIASLLSARHPDWRIEVAAGVMPARTEQTTSGSVTYHSGTDLSRIMRGADLAVVAAGSICWELAFFGVPMLTLTVADNQEPIAHGLAEAVAARSLGWYDRVSDARIAETVDLLVGDADRLEMGRRGQSLIDGRGADRVAATLMTGIPQ